MHLRKWFATVGSCLVFAACGGGDDDDSAAIDATPSVGADAASTGAVDAAAPDAALPGIDATPPDAGPPQTFYWADWTAATAGTDGTASGTFEPPSGSISIGYTGQIAFAQTDGGTNYWVPGDPYINAVTANAPDQPDIIALTGVDGVTQTLTFDPPVTGLVMGLVSLGTPSTNVKYVFDTPIVLLSYGAGYWGDGTIVVEGDSTISGTEGHGAVQFTGTVSSVSWTVVGSESWHGFTVGVPAQ